uniref:Reverse transcriptase domain-containing protein n=1 Tax=Amphilophus citrinellus TaxID=61819 RepID=A0A3Q0S8N0_AMPCI
MYSPQLPRDNRPPSRMARSASCSPELLANGRLQSGRKRGHGSSPSPPASPRRKLDLPDTRRNLFPKSPGTGGILLFSSDLAGLGRRKTGGDGAEKPDGRVEAAGPPPPRPDLSFLRASLPVPPAVAVLKERIADSIRVEGEDPVLFPLGTSPKEVSERLRRVIRLLSRFPKVQAWLSAGRMQRRRTVSGVKRSKIRAYRSLQRRYQRDRRGAARLILDGRDHIACDEPEEIVSAYKGVWEAKERFTSLGAFGELPLVDNDDFGGPFTPAEAKWAISKILPGSSPGPDGLTRGVILAWDPEGVRLAELFNAILLNGKLPNCLKRSRTTLIPKSFLPAKLSDISNWRPITIGSALCRAFSSVLNSRLSAMCGLHPGQRGFTCSPGCSQNLVILDYLMRRSRKRKRPLAIVFIDFAKAFDSVSHQHTAQVLERRGVDVLLRRLIKNLYAGCHTRIQTRNGESRPIQLQVGVKQGDPLSPFLFNLALDPLLRMLESTGMGFNVDGCKVSFLAFADDLVLVSESWAGMQRNLDILEVFWDMTGLRVNPTKSHGFMIGKERRRYTLNDCDQWLFGGSPIPMVGAQESVEYLGMAVNPIKGILRPPVGETMSELLRRISAVPLKPTQCLQMLKTFALPRLTYVADHGLAGQALLLPCDREVKTTVKRWLHLDQGTSDGLLYSQHRDGGLGISKLSALIPITQGRRMVKLYHSVDVRTREVIRALVPHDDILKAWNKARWIVGGLPEVTAVPALSELKAVTTPRWRQKEFERWTKCRVQGVGVAVFKDDRISNHWLHDPGSFGIRESEVTLFLQLHSNTLPTRLTEMRNLGPDPADVTCRLCGREVESMRHLIGWCASLKDNRIKSHNKVCDFLAKEMESCGWSVRRELWWPSDDGSTLAPDMVLLKGSRAVILDVMIRFEASIAGLADAAAAKAKKYEKLRPVIQRLRPSLTKIQSVGFPLGARGKWYGGNGNLLIDMGITKARVKQIAVILSRRAMIYTANTLKAYYRLLKLAEPRPPHP